MGFGSAEPLGLLSRLLLARTFTRLSPVFFFSFPLSLRGYTFKVKKKQKKTTFMVLAEDFTMSRTDEVHRLTENVYKVRFN